MEALIQVVKIFGDAIRVEFGLETGLMLIMRAGKRNMIAGIELPNERKIRIFREKESFKYLEIMEAETIYQAEMKESIKKEYLRGTKNFLNTNCITNRIQRINTCVALVVR